MPFAPLLGCIGLLWNCAEFARRNDGSLLFALGQLLVFAIAQFLTLPGEFAAAQSDSRTLQQLENHRPNE